MACFVLGNSEIAELMAVKSKHGAGGEYTPDWMPKVRCPCTTSLATANHVSFYHTQQAFPGSSHVQKQGELVGSTPPPPLPLLLTLIATASCRGWWLCLLSRSYPRDPFRGLTPCICLYQRRTNRFLRMGPLRASSHQYQEAGIAPRPSDGPRALRRWLAR